VDVTPDGDVAAAAHPEIMQIECHRTISKGNCYFGCINEVDVHEEE
jgi:hypothetical protein